jgi:hypothetical protein
MKKKIYLTAAAAFNKIKYELSNEYENDIKTNLKWLGKMCMHI